MRHFTSFSTALLAIVCCAPLSAQTSTTAEGLSLRGTIEQLTNPLAAPAVGEVIAAGTALEVTTTPFGTSSGGFVFKLDPSTGLRVRTATTFGPAFAERVLTAGEGKISVAANLIVASYDKLNNLELKQMRVTDVQAPSSTVARSGFMSLVLSSETLVLSGIIGATDKLDVVAAVPFVKVKLDGLSWVQQRNGDVILRAAGAASSSGIGDIGVGIKYRLIKLGEGEPDPGGLAVLLTARLPTGNRENFRGLGIARTQGSALFSFGRGKLRPHFNGGYEWWEKGVPVVTDFRQNTSVSARHQVMYAAGLEYEGGPKVTLLLDLLGRHILGGGRQGFSTEIPPPNPFGVTSVESAVALNKGIRKVTLVPGIKWNLKGTFVFAFNALVPVSDNGLHDLFTPVVGLDFTF
jgi:hypothetical protein